MLLSALLLPVLDVAEICVQPFEALLPVASVLAHPIGDIPEGTGPEASGSPLRLPPLLDEPGSFEHPEMLGDGGLTHVEWRGQVLDRGFAFGQPGQDRPASRVRQGCEGDAERVGLH